MSDPRTPDDRVSDALDRLQNRVSELEATARRDRERQDIAIAAAADALLAACALQTGTDPEDAVTRALDAVAQVADQTRAEQQLNGW